MLAAMVVKKSRVNVTADDVPQPASDEPSSPVKSTEEMFTRLVSAETSRNADAALAAAEPATEEAIVRPKVGATSCARLL